MKNIPRDLLRRLEIAAMFAELDGYEQIDRQLSDSAARRRARRAAAELARYHALLPEQRRERNRRQWDSIKSDPQRREDRRAYTRQQMRDLRAAGGSQYQRLSPEARRALNKAAYAKKVATPEARERKRAANREWVRQKRRSEHGQRRAG